MRTLVIVTHPNINQSTVNRTWRDTLEQHEDIVTVHELYATYPDLDIDIEYEQKLLSEHDQIIFQFPLYWYSYPPLMKKYFDDVLAYGWAYGSNGHALKGKTFAAAISVGATEEQYHSESWLGFSLETLLSPFIATAKFVGANYNGYHALFGALNPTQEDLEQSVASYIEFIKGMEVE
ncbi:NAD(P)H-dependent oxidoreductase [Staphylococcus sp. SQ8-PEA]|uniref:NAD(P)H-dependent oxidoreductase n=1 Tax=Staphylococcus marylandisciuri TaxID=2981529 RepID=A0ABT2QN04_9STAP|nr:NAD(P)H-dependent oxidoreductase [Staphylococcus marylandisciuri]MCU5745340.1 NAD(P)H-dependent oxidoreductase [Staphylococcus marylandisciuri]